MQGRITSCGADVGYEQRRRRACVTPSMRCVQLFCGAAHERAEDGMLRITRGDASTMTPWSGKHTRARVRGRGAREEHGVGPEQKVAQPTQRQRTCTMGRKCSLGCCGCCAAPAAPPPPPPAVGEPGPPLASCPCAAAAAAPCCAGGWGLGGGTSSDVFCSDSRWRTCAGSVRWRMLGLELVVNWVSARSLVQRPCSASSDGSGACGCRGPCT